MNYIDEAGPQPPHIPDNASVKVLRECIALQQKKSEDYQNPSSSVRQAMHYRRGVDTIHDMIEQKLLRARSLIEAMQQPTVSVAVNFESLEDTYKDLANYASFAVAYIRGEMDGQDEHHDAFNRPLSKKWNGGGNTLKNVADRLEKVVDDYKKETATSYYQNIHHTSTAYDDLPSDVEPNSDIIDVRMTDEYAVLHGLDGNNVSDRDKETIAAVVDVLNTRSTTGYFGTNDRIEEEVRRAKAKLVRAGVGFSKGDDVLELYRANILANDAVNSRAALPDEDDVKEDIQYFKNKVETARAQLDVLREASDITRHARARGLPPELAKTPFPPEGHPAYDKPVPPHTKVDRVNQTMGPLPVEPYTEVGL